ncbi:nitroreductase/quinone reductase family protein [Streptomyces sp. NPDC059690]|uniref:nitroreductase/quinone reductase family protein n=1 Tax=Streptomyces sp. NPDC059690 TaxID=3346907 RepID=UPI00367C8E22
MNDGADIVVVASQGGLPRHPQWYLNLGAHPDTHIQIRADRRPVRARTADPEERGRLWPLLLDVNADFELYQSWTEREIPVVILQPRSGG